MKILVVEDSSFARMAATKVIGMLLPDAQFIEAGDGAAGLELFLQNAPDLVFTDLLMPKMSGETLVAEIRRHNSSVPIIVMTANIQKPAREKMESLGITGFVTKPINGESLKILRELLAGYIHA